MTITAGTPAVMAFKFRFASGIRFRSEPPCRSRYHGVLNSENGRKNNSVPLYTRQRLFRFPARFIRKRSLPLRKRGHGCIAANLADKITGQA